MYQSLIIHIKKHVTLSADEEQVIQSHLSSESFKKKAHALTEGNICKANYFVNKGCFRCYFIDSKGAEHTTQFGIENWWITDYMSLSTQMPSHFYIQAVENSEVIILTKRMQDDLLTKVPQLERYFRLMLQKAYAASQMRIKYLFSQSGEDRYHHFNKLYPWFVQRVPQYMLASYLGFTPEFLSKIRAKV